MNESQSFWSGHVALAAVLGIIAVACLFFVERLWRNRHFRTVERAYETAHQNKIVFLFRDKALIDATASARVLLKFHSVAHVSEWDALMRGLETDFPSLPKKLQRDLHEHSLLLIESTHQTDTQIRAEIWGDILRLEVLDLREQRNLHSDPMIELLAFGSELQMLKQLAGVSDLSNFAKTIEGPVANRECASAPLHTSPRVNPNNTPVPQKDALLKPDLHNVILRTISENMIDISLGVGLLDEDFLLTSFNPALSKFAKQKPEALAKKPNIKTLLQAMHAKPLPADFPDKDVFCQSLTLQDPGTKPSAQVTLRKLSFGGYILIISGMQSVSCGSPSDKILFEKAKSLVDSIKKPAIVMHSLLGSDVAIANHQYRSLWKRAEDMGAKTNLDLERQNWRSDFIDETISSKLERFICSNEGFQERTVHTTLRTGVNLEITKEQLGHGFKAIVFQPIHNHQTHISRPSEDSTAMSC